MVTKKHIITKLFTQNSINDKEKENIEQVIQYLDTGKIRVAEKQGNNWQINEWVKKAILLYFQIRKMKTIELGPF